MEKKEKKNTARDGKKIRTYEGSKPSKLGIVVGRKLKIKKQ